MRKRPCNPGFRRCQTCARYSKKRFEAENQAKLMLWKWEKSLLRKIIRVLEEILGSRDTNMTRPQSFWSLDLYY